MAYAELWLKNSFFRYRGNILFENDQKIILADPISGRTEISKDSIASISRKEDKDSVGSDARD